MVNVLPELGKRRGFGETFSENFSSAFNKSLERAEKLSGERRRIRERVPTSLRSNLSLYDQDKSIRSRPEEIDRIKRKMYELVDQGYDPEDAFSLAYHGEENGEIPGANEKKSPSTAEKLSQFGEDVKIGGLKGIRPFIHLGSALKSPQQLMLEAIEGPPEKTALTEFDRLTEGKGKPTNVVERAIQGFPIGPAGVVQSYTEESLNVEGIPDWVREGAGFLAFVGTAGRSGRMPQLKLANGVMRDAKKLAKTTGKPVESLIDEAVSASGTDLRKIAAGDIAETEKFSAVLPQVAERVKTTPRNTFNPSKAIEERELFGKRVKESPLGEYYEHLAKDQKRLASRKPSTIAAEEARIAQLRPIETEAYAAVQREGDALRQLRGRGEKMREVEAQQSKLASEVEKLRDIKYEIKHGKKRESLAELQKKAEESIQGLRQEAASPTLEGQATLAKQLANDQKYLDRAAMLAERGSLPSEFSPDTFLKIKEKYAQAYREAASMQREAMKSLKGEELESAKRFMKYLDQRSSRALADIINQRDRIAAMRRLEKPSGAFFKQQLKETRKDIDAFKKDFFRVKRLRGDLERKTEKAFSKSMTPREEVKVEQVKEKLGDLIKEKPELFESAKLGNREAQKKIESEMTKWIRGLGIAAGSGALIGSIQAAVEEIFGYRPTVSMITKIIGAPGYAALGIGPLVRNTLREFFEKEDVERLKRAKPGPEAAGIWRDIIERRGEPRARAVRKRAFSKD